MEYWSGAESNFGVKKWAALPFIQTKPGHILDNTKNTNFHSEGVRVNSYQTCQSLDRPTQYYTAGVADIWFTQIL